MLVLKRIKERPDTVLKFLSYNTSREPVMKMDYSLLLLIVMGRTTIRYLGNMMEGKVIRNNKS